MTTLDYIRELLHLVAGALIWPVMIGLLGLAASMLVTIGAFTREAFDRFRGRKRRLAASSERLTKATNSEESDALDLRLERLLQLARGLEYAALLKSAPREIDALFWSQAEKSRRPTKAIHLASSSSAPGAGFAPS